MKYEIIRERGVEKQKRSSQSLRKNVLKSILEPSFFPNCISNPTKISPFQSPPNSFVHRERCDSRSRQLSSQKLVRRNPFPTDVLPIVAVEIIIFTISPPILPILIFQYLRPVRHVHRQRRSRPTNNHLRSR
ncbi:unnamed protein product [Coffea canephora]|uniref:DH200=94 genomic scaffold, scaffold_719 n=1 Tax=Coffea canephora TaxID=49390 RepID=A0A068VGI4_COFCA|nr:unnamed protein product [Coffea canephora]